MSAYSDKVVWVTGASSGIGEALALNLSRQGAIVVLSARRREELQRVADACEGPALVLPLDLAMPDTLSGCVRTVLDTFGRVDTLIHNGGISQRSCVQDTELAVYRRLMDVNFFGPVALTQAVLPSMLAAGCGHLIVMSSVVGKFGTPLRSGYAASKHALHGFFDSLRLEVMNRGVSVTLVCPGYVRTRVSFNALTAAGDVHGRMDTTTAGGMDPGDFARRMLYAVADGPREVCIGGPEILGVWLSRLFPKQLDRMLIRRFSKRR